MAQYGYAYKVGHDQSSLINVETIVTYAPTSKPAPLGSIKERVLSQKSQWNGTREIKWFWGAMSWDDFEDLILDMFGDWETESVDQTIDSRGRDEEFHRFNVTTDTPVEGQDYTRQAHGDVEGLTITHRVIEEIAIP